MSTDWRIRESECLYLYEYFLEEKKLKWCIRSTFGARKNDLLLLVVDFSYIQQAVKSAVMSTWYILKASR